MRSLAITEQNHDHGAVLRANLVVNSSDAASGGVTIGRVFPADGPGPDQARARVQELKRDPNVIRIEVLEASVFADGVSSRSWVEIWERGPVYECQPLTVGGSFPDVPLRVRRTTQGEEAEIKSPTGEAALQPLGVLVDSYAPPQGFESWQGWLADTRPWIRVEARP